MLYLNMDTAYAKEQLRHTLFRYRKAIRAAAEVIASIDTSVISIYIVR